MKKKKGMIYSACALILLCALYVGVNFYLTGSEKKEN